MRPTKACHGLPDVPARVLKFACWSPAVSFSVSVKGPWTMRLAPRLCGVATVRSIQTSQGVRVKGEFDKNWLLFLGATLRYQF